MSTLSAPGEARRPPPRPRPGVWEPLRADDLWRPESALRRGPAGRPCPHPATGIRVGYCITSISPEHVGKIESLFIGEAYRSRGNGTTFMNRAPA
ncbi:GNAT family N-acetyltransferase [Methanoculleus sp.]|uniref:GNAT family N-acetyltransferase n=1 Tax=Methanoculleus sp. TaxID=90427 RepID=UPI002D1FB213|nr:GNAT family N-acetyltransferase [Methanoculleus sp.]